MKNEDHNPSENEATRSYKKRYLVRKIQEQEAEKELKEFKEEEPEEHSERDNG